MCSPYQKPAIEIIPAELLYPAVCAGTDTTTFLFSDTSCPGYSSGQIDVTNGNASVCFSEPSFAVPGNLATIKCSETGATEYSVTIVSVANCAADNTCSPIGESPNTGGKCDMEVNIDPNAPSVCTITSFLSSTGSQEC